MTQILAIETGHFSCLFKHKHYHYPFGFEQ